MKKTISLLLTALLLFSLGGAAWADGESVEKVWTGTLSGVELWIPMEFREAEGSLEFYDSGEGYTPGEGVLSVSIDYIAMPAREYYQLSEQQMEAFLTGDLDRLSALNEQIAGKILPLGSVIALDGGRGEKELRERLMSMNLDPTYFEDEEELFLQLTELYENLVVIPIGERDGYAYFYCAFEPELLLGFFSPELIGENYLAEFMALADDPGLIVDNVRLIGGVQASAAGEGSVLDESVPEASAPAENTAAFDAAISEEATESLVEASPVDAAEAPAETAPAENDAVLEEADATVVDAPYAGFHFELPERYEKLRGQLSWSGGGPIDPADPGIVAIQTLYYAVPAEDWDAYVEYTNARLAALESGADSPEAPKPGWDDHHMCGCLFEIVGIDGDRGLNELLPFLAEYNEPYGADFVNLEKIGKVGDTTFFLAQYSEFEDEMDAYASAMGELFDEFYSLWTDRGAFLSGLSLTEPLSIHAENGGTVSFRTTDLSGNVVTSEELFADHKVTMLNLWATWCGPCRGELRELGNLAREFEKQGCQIIGVCLDGAESGREARALLKENGADYLNLVCTDEIEDQLFTLYVPTSFFVDSEGNLLTDPVVGANVELYPQAMAEALALVG